jgi:hypothetical protein
MKQLIRISRLDRVITVLDGSAQLENPYDVCNLRLQGYDCYMRYGYTNKAAKQAGFVDGTAYGLGWFEGVSQVTGETKRSRKEYFLTIENTGSIRPYLRNITTLAPTQIGTTTLTDGYWNFASYNDYVYAIRPEADEISPTPQPTVYKHLLGETVGSNAWEQVQNSSYVDPGSDAELAVLANSPTVRPFIASDSFTFPTATNVNDIGIWNAGSTFVINATNGIDVSGNNNDNGQQSNIAFTVTFSPTENWSTFGDYAAITITAGNVFSILTLSNKAPILRTAGVDRTLEYREFVNTLNNTVTIMFRLKGVPSLNLVEKFTFTVSSNVNRYVNGLACKFEPIKFGGVYLEQTGTAQRIWDDTLVGNGIYYGVRYKNGGTYSNLIQQSITAVQSQGFTASSISRPLGGKITLSVPQRTVGGWTDVEFVRQLDDASGWKVISTQANSGGTIQFKDTYQENELSPLPTATGIGTVLPPAPPFRTTGIVGAFPYKQSMVWLINQTFQNLQFSRVGNPLELYDSGASLSYDPEDVTIPAQYTLADDQADIPVWGTQAGQIAFIIGKSAAYAMVGEYPRAMSPSRQIPGSRGIAGYYAGTRFRSNQGVWGAAYADSDLNIWLVNSIPRFVGDASVQPQELSLSVRGKLRQFLYEDQKLQLSNITIQDVKLAFQESTSSLWVVLGKRAAVYRQDMVGTGWELYDYTLSSDVTVATCTDFYTTGATASEHDNGTGWSNFGFPFASDNSYCTNTFALGAGANNYRTKYLTADGYLPSPLIPTNATITGVTYRLEDSKTGDLAVTNNHAHPSYNNAPLGSNLSTNRVATTSDVTQDFAMVSLPTVAQLNSGLMGIDIRYESEEWLSAWLDPANYTVVITPTSPQVRVPADPIPYITVYTVTVTYTAGGTKPPYAFVNLTGQTTIGGDVVPTLGTGDTDNGLGGTNSGQIGTLAAVPPDPPTAYTVSTNTTVRQKVLLSSGVGTYQVTMTSNGTLPTNKFQATHTLTGVFDPATLATVRVDNVAMKVCYTVTSTGTNIQWNRLAFSPNDKYLAFRSSGELDVIERDAFTSGFPFIGGTNRDSGLTPPNWYFTTQQIQWDGAKARLASVQYHGDTGSDIITTGLAVDNDTNFVQGALAGVNTSRWYGWHPSVSSGIRHKVKFTGNETDNSLKGFALEFNTQSKGKPK